MANSRVLGERLESGVWMWALNIGTVSGGSKTTGEGNGKRGKGVYCSDMEWKMFFPPLFFPVEHLY